MLLRAIALSLCTGLLLNGCSTATNLQSAAQGTAVLIGATGQPTGAALLTISREGAMQLAIEVTGLKPQHRHGVHLHTTGTCQAPAFASAGPHLNPNGRKHGLENPAGSHLGDLPNLIADDHGTARIAATLPGDPAALLQQLFDQDGTAIVLHADADDLRTDPSGNSGARIACGTMRAR